MARGARSAPGMIRPAMLGGPLTTLVAKALVVLWFFSCGGSTEPPTRFDPSADPARDVAAAVARVEGTDRAVLVEVGGDWCSDTRALDGIFESDPKVSSLLSDHFELVRVHTSDDVSNAAFLKRFPSFDGVPHLFLLDAQGALAASASGEAMVTQPPRDEAPRRAAKLLEAWSKR